MIGEDIAETGQTSLDERKWGLTLESLGTLNFCTAIVEVVEGGIHRSRRWDEQVIPYYAWDVRHVMAERLTLATHCPDTALLALYHTCTKRNGEESPVLGSSR